MGGGKLRLRGEGGGKRPLLGAAPAVLGDPGKGVAALPEPGSGTGELETPCGASVGGREGDGDDNDDHGGDSAAVRATDRATSVARVTNPSVTASGDRMSASMAPITFDTWDGVGSGSPDPRPTTAARCRRRLGDKTGSGTG